MTQLSNPASIVLVGTGATLLMDLWLVLLQRAGIQTQSFAMIGRWVGHLAAGRIAHASIAQALPVRGELVLGWVVHYAIGIAFAGLLVALAGPGWIAVPTFAPAALLGLVTVIAPLFVLQPAMGAGFMARRTARPLANCMRSLATHAVFGFGLYVAAIAIAWTRS